jgi:hypothetical protein
MKFSAEFMKNSLLWDVAHVFRDTTCVLAIDSLPTFWKTYFLHLQGSRISHAGNQLDAGSGRAQKLELFIITAYLYFS